MSVQRDWGSALHAASCGGHEAIVQMLLDKETDAASVVGFQKFGSLWFSEWERSLSDSEN
jgi:hypothetical protein